MSLESTAEMFAELGPEGLETLCIVDAMGRKHIVTLRAPLQLPGGE